MIRLKENFMFSPGGENEKGNTSSDKNDVKNEHSDMTSKPKEEEKSFIKKIKEALQEWSNDDQRDLEYDDTKV